MTTVSFSIAGEAYEEGARILLLQAQRIEELACCVGKCAVAI